MHPSGLFAVSAVLLSCVAHVTCFSAHPALRPSPTLAAIKDRLFSGGPASASRARSHSTAVSMALQRGIVKTDVGEVFYAEHTPEREPVGLPLLCMHMNPRSSDEFLEAGALLSEKHGRRVVAVDAPGFGCSPNPARSCDEDDLAAAMIEVADALGLSRFAAVGSLAGCRRALVLSKRHPNRVGAVVLTNPLFTRPDQPSTPQDPAKVFPLEEDGAHLPGLWKRRAGWLDSAMNQRAVLDEQRVLMNKVDGLQRGIVIKDVSTENYLECVRTLQCPSLVVMGIHAEGMFANMGWTGVFDACVGALPKERTKCVRVEGGSINLINTHAEEWVRHVEGLLGGAE